MSDLRTLFADAVPDLSFNGEGRSDTVFTTEEKLCSAGFVLRQKHLCGEQCSDVVCHYSMKTCQLLKALTERKFPVSQSSEAVCYRSPVC